MNYHVIILLFLEITRRVLYRYIEPPKERDRWRVKHYYYATVAYFIILIMLIMGIFGYYSGLWVVMQMSMLLYMMLSVIVASRHFVCALGSSILWKRDWPFWINGIVNLALVPVIFLIK